MNLSNFCVIKTTGVYGKNTMAILPDTPVFLIKYYRSSAGVLAEINDGPDELSICYGINYDTYGCGA
jgi:hypothetical protein